MTSHTSFSVCRKGTLRRAALALSGAAIAAATWLAPSDARADIRIWEENPDSKKNHRYFDFYFYAQPGYVWRQNDPDENNPIEDDGFLLQRARFGFWTRTASFLKLRFETETTPNTTLQDAFADFDLSQQFNIRFGQFQLPFLRTFQFSERYLAFIDRHIYTALGQDRAYLRYLSPREVGAMFYGSIGDLSEGATTPAMQYWVGAFLGRGPNQTRNEDNALLYSARVQVHTLGMPRGVNQESDLARNEHPRVAVAGGVYTNCDDRNQWNRGFSTDAEFRYEGFFAYGTFVWFKNGSTGDSGFAKALNYDEFCKDTPTPDHIATGSSLQAQYVLPESVTGPDQALELLVRYDDVRPVNPCNTDTGECGFLGKGSDTPGYVRPTNFNDSDNPPSRWRTTIGVNWFPTAEQRLRLSLNYQLNREVEKVQTSDGLVQGIKNDYIWFQMTAGL